MTTIQPERGATDRLTRFTPCVQARLATGDRPARPLFFGSSEKPLFGWHHPANGPVSRASAVVLCPPLGYEYMCSHRTIRQLAERLAAVGFDVLRFDYHGTGDSSGCAQDAGRVAAWIDSIRCAIDELRTASRRPRVTLVGLRLGATLAAAAAAGRDDVDGLVLWHPCVSGKSYVREMRALRMASMMDSPDEGTASPAPGAATQLEAAGFSLSPSTIAELGALDLLRMRHAPPPAVLVIARDDLARDEALVQHLRARGAAATQQWLPGYAALMVMPLRAVPPAASMDAIVAWLSGSCDAGAPASYGADDDGAAPTHEHEHAGHAGHATTMRVSASAVADEVRETPVVFGERSRLFGILTEPVHPTSDRGRPAVLLLNTGGDHHVGPHRLYPPLARRWAALGFSVLRFDLAGLGESQPAEGAADNVAYPDSAMDDIRAALAFLRTARGIGRVILAGMCSGGYHAIHTVRAGLPIAGRIAINPPLYWRPGDSVDVDRSWNHYEMNRIARALFMRSKWKRALRGEVDFQYIGGVIAAKAATITHSKLWTMRRMIGTPSTQLSDGIDFPALFPPDIDTFLVFSRGDPGLTYMERCAGTNMERWRARRTFKLDVIDGADHTFMPGVWQARLGALLTEYLVERYRG